MSWGIGVACPKPRPKLLDKREQAGATRLEDIRQRIVCRLRADGRCEVHEVGAGRCRRVPTDNHHLLGGIGRRNKGRSILAAHRIAVCRLCHADITGHVLTPNSDTFSTSLRFGRVR